MPTKKKKYNARFPPARIKKIMQKDEEVGKVASTVPVMISRLLELFTESLILKTNELTLSVNARTLTTSHLKQIILSERKFDFLKDLVAHIPDVQANEEEGGDSNSDQGSRIRQRGRPRKKKEGEVNVPKKRGRKPKAAASLSEYAAEEDATDDSETEDAESNEGEDGDSLSDDTTTSTQSHKRQRTDDSHASSGGPSCGANMQYHGNLKHDSATAGAEREASSASAVDQKIGFCQQPEGFKHWNPQTGFGGCFTGQTSNESCLPLNLKTASLAAVAANSKNIGQDMETQLVHPHQQPLHHTGMNQMMCQTDTSGLILNAQRVGPSLEPPPAHQPVGQSQRSLFHPTSCPIPSDARTNVLSNTASECIPQNNATSSFGFGVVTTRPPAENVPSGSRALPDGISTGAPSLMTSTSGHAVHRMPVVPASFLPGAVFTRSLSVPHSSSATKPSPLVTLPDEDYDS